MVNTIENSKRRIVWLDYVRFIGIFLVVLGHTSLPGEAITFIYLFHMPLFFTISGFLFSKSKYTGYLDFVKIKAKQLLIPYLFFSVVTGLFWYFVGRRFGNDVNLPNGISDILIGFLSGQNIVYNVVLWFLPALFVTENLYYIMSRRLNPVQIACLFFTIGWLYNSFIAIQLPLSIDIAFVAIVFYAIGATLKSLFNTENPSVIEISKMKAWVFILGFVSLVAIEVMFESVLGRVDMRERAFAIFPLYILSAIVGTLATFCLGILCEKAIGNMRLITYYATYTIVIMALHSQVMRVLKGVGLMLFDLPLYQYTNSYLHNIVIAIAAFGLLLPIIWVLSRYTPKLIGR